VVRRVQALTVVPLNEGCDLAVILSAVQAAAAMGACNEAALPVARLSVRVVGGCAVHRRALSIDPAHCAVVRDILKQKTSRVAHPDRALNPTETGSEFLKLVICEDISRETPIINFKATHGSPESARRGTLGKNLKLNDHQHSRLVPNGAGKMAPSAFYLAG